MKTTLRLMALVLTLGLPVLARAAGAPQTKAAMTAAGCFACHGVSHKIVGPAYSWVAYVFAHKPDSRVLLARKIISGGAGRWNPWTGGIPMPPHPQLTLVQAKQMASWVLAQRPMVPPKP